MFGDSRKVYRGVRMNGCGAVETKDLHEVERDLTSRSLGPEGQGQGQGQSGLLNL
jgi:hypothetical protein